MRLEAMLLPDALHGRVADADLLGQHTCAPVRCVLGLLLGCTLHDREPHLGTDRLLAGARALAPVLEQALDATIGNAVGGPVQISCSVCRVVSPPERVRPSRKPKHGEGSGAGPEAKKDPWHRISGLISFPSLASPVLLRCMSQQGAVADVVEIRMMLSPAFSGYRVMRQRQAVC